MINDIEPKVLCELLRYEPETGKLFWRERPLKFFSSESNCKSWNTKNAGKEALIGNNKGHLGGCIFGKRYKTHRVIWAMFYGEWPIHHVDHINGIRDDNRIENLRDVPHLDNSRNQKMPCTNTSGCVGVRQVGNKWTSRIMCDQKTIHLGTFEYVDDAISARKNAEIQYGFHENHGR